MIKASEIMDRAAVHLNDRHKDYFTYDVLTPFLQIALDDLRGELYENNIPVTNSRSAELQITTAMTDIGGPTGPPLPEALVEIQTLYERTYGTSEEFIEMSKVTFLPVTDILLNQLICWSWQNQEIKFVGANSVRGVKIDYIEDTLLKKVNKDSVIEMIHAKPYLAYRTAAHAASDDGEDTERSDRLNANAGIELEKLMNLSIKGLQSVPIRRRPFMASWKRRGGGGAITGR